MKIYKHDYVFYIRLTFKQRGVPNEYLPLIETTLDEVEIVLKSALRDKIDPFDKGLTTTIEMREAQGGKNGKYKQISFKGLTPMEAKEIVTNYINSI